MYKLLLILKYLRRKLAPLFAAFAVMICTAMVIIVISVMGGFLELMRDAARRGTGDITIEAGWTGFPHYEALARELELLPEVEAATPVMVGAGMVKLGDRVQVAPVVLGIDPQDMNAVLPFRETLYWNDENLPARNVRDRSMRWQLPWESDTSRRERQPDGAIMPGIEVFPKQRDDGGAYASWQALVGAPMQLTIVPVTQKGGILEPSTRELIVVNEVKSGLYDIDKSHIFVPFDVLQDMMGMGADEVVNPETGEPTGERVEPRTSRILVRVKEGVALEDAHRVVSEYCTLFVAGRTDMPGVYTYTWEDQHANLLNAVQNEKALITVLFVIISIVAVVMVATIFYMIVLEKTRDIGVLRAIGASRLGIANIFLGYGLTIGVIGAALGVALGVTFVYNLNELQAVLDAWFGWRMWNPQTYYFDEIPEQVDYAEAAFIACGAVVSSLAGALIPAALAARLDPVESLRYE